MSLSNINTLYKIAEERTKTEEGKEELASEELEDEMEEAVMP